MSYDQSSNSRRIEPWSSDGFGHGIIDLYARRMEMVAYQREVTRAESLDRQVITQPFGRPFTARPSSPPEAEHAPGGWSELRRKLTIPGRGPRRRLATS